jgi:predicted SnoaL-like aldol condensation-catalyzing enzyme
LSRYTFKYEPGMAVAEGDLVMVHGRYTGWGPKPMVAVDIFRIADGRVVEHWDVMQQEVPASETASGNPMFAPRPTT